MNQFKRGLALAGDSWRTLRSHRSLVLFPVIGTAMALVVVGPPALAGAYLADRGDTVPGALLGALAIYLICFVSAFVGVGLAAAADAVLRGERGGFGYGVRVASGRLPAITGWALINALLTIVLRALESRSELAAIAASLVGGAWSVISLLAIPAIALENAGPIEAIKRSTGLFKEHWGGRVTGMAAIGIGVFLLVMLPAILIGAGGVVILSDAGSAGVGAGAALIGVAAVIFCAGVVLSSALRQVFAVALFRYTTSGQAPQGFDGAELERAVRVHGRRGEAGVAVQ
jgi:Family of unknown function (DUF6159)